MGKLIKGGNHVPFPFDFSLFSTVSIIRQFPYLFARAGKRIYHQFAGYVRNVREFWRIYWRQSWGLSWLGRQYRFHCFSGKLKHLFLNIFECDLPNRRRFRVKWWFYLKNHIIEAFQLKLVKTYLKIGHSKLTNDYIIAWYTKSRCNNSVVIQFIINGIPHS